MDETKISTEFSLSEPIASKIQFKGDIVKGLIGAKRQAVQLLLDLLELKQYKLEQLKDATTGDTTEEPMVLETTETIAEEAITTAETETNEETILLLEPEEAEAVVSIISPDPITTTTKPTTTTTEATTTTTEATATTAENRCRTIDIEVRKWVKQMVGVITWGLNILKNV